MTVVNMLSLGNEGVAVADEQASTRLRKYDLTQKLGILSAEGRDLAVYGFSGPIDMLKGVYDETQEVLESMGTERTLKLKDVTREVDTTLIRRLHEIRNNYLLKHAGITYDELITGMHLESGKPLSTQIQDLGGNILGRLGEKTSAGILIGGLEKGAFRIYSTSTGGDPERVSMPYQSIGSGSDQSDEVLASFITRMRREQRDSIDPADGLIAVLKATNASSRVNQGVGGIPSIAYVTSEGRIYQPGEDECLLVGELVQGLENNLLDRDFCRTKVVGLVNGERSYGLEKTRQTP